MRLEKQDGHCRERLTYGPSEKFCNIVLANAGKKALENPLLFRSRLDCRTFARSHSSFVVPGNAMAVPGEKRLEARGVKGVKLLN